jgi:hypothetical protein
VIHHVDKALESFLRQYVPLAEADIDVSFQPPDGTWTASVARPTVDVFLWDVGRAKRSQTTGLDQRLTNGGRRQQRPQPVMVALRYFITVWAREQRDEHELLGAILHSVLGHDTLPADLLPAALTETPCRLMLGDDQHRLPPSLWNGSAPKAGIYLEAALAVDAIGWTDRGAPVEELRVEVSGVTETAGVVATRSTPRAASAARQDPSAPEPVEPPPLRRFRSGAALVMEGRPQPAAKPAAARGEQEGDDAR